jgi:hypothetical protein
MVLTDLDVFVSGMTRLGGTAAADFTVRINHERRRADSEGRPKVV